MAFEDRIVEYPNRYIFESEDGTQSEPYTLIRSEGEIEQPGTLLNAANLNTEIQAMIDAAKPVTVDNSVATGSIGAGAYKNVSVPLTAPSGKTLCAVAGVFVSGTNYQKCRTIGFYYNSTENAVHVQVQNDHSASVNWTVRAWGLYA